MPDNGPHYYAKAEWDEPAAVMRYHKQWIDTFGTPHATGEYVSVYRLMKDEMQYGSGDPRVEQGSAIHPPTHPRIHPLIHPISLAMSTSPWH